MPRGGRRNPAEFTDMFADDAWVQVEEMNMDMDMTIDEEDDEDDSEDDNDMVNAEDEGIVDSLRVQGRAMTTRTGHAHRGQSVGFPATIN